MEEGGSTQGATREAMHAAIDAGYAFIALGLTVEGDGMVVEDHGDGTMSFHGRIRPIDRERTFFVDCVFLLGSEE